MHIDRIFVLIYNGGVYKNGEKIMQFSNINYNLYKSFLVVYETRNIKRISRCDFGERNMAVVDQQ